MPQCCAVPNCSNKKGGHKFPKDKSRLEQWLQAIRRDRYTPTHHSLVCKDHFTMDDYELPKDSVLERPRLVLKKDAVPSKFSWNKATFQDQYQRCLDRNIRKNSELKSEEKTIEIESYRTSDKDSFHCTEFRCHTCLQQDRTLRPLKTHAKQLFTMLYPEMFYETKDTAEYLICWECEYMVDKITRFQDKLKKANQLLKLSLKGKATIVEGLSSQKITKLEIISITPQTSHNLLIQPQNLPIQLQNLPIQPQNLPIQLQNLPIQPQNLPIQLQNLPIQPQNLPIQLQNLPIQPQNLPIQLQNLSNVPQKLPIILQNRQILPENQQQNPPFIISPENIMQLSLKDMLEAPSKFQTKIKIEPNEEEDYSNDCSDEGSCSNDLDDPVQPKTKQHFSCDPLMEPRQDQPMSWPEIEVAPLLQKPIKNEIVTPVSLPQDAFPNEQIPLRGLREVVKVTACKQEPLVKTQRKNDLLTKLLSNPSKGEELFLMRQPVPNEPEGSKQNCEEDEAKVIILNDKELEQVRAKRRSHHSYVLSQYKCDKCLEFYQSQEKIDEHNLKHDESRGNLICEICEQRFADGNELNDHYKGHFIIYECMKCPYRNRNRLMLSEHCRRKHEESSFYCKICFQEFKTFKERRVHVDRVHDQKLACKECKKTFANMSRLKMHVLNIHESKPVACPICKKKIKAYYLKNHLKTHNERDDSYYCADCATFYKTKLTYELHLKTTLKHNTLEKLGIKCDHCDKYFGTRESLKNHVEEIGGVKYTCDICKKNCKSKKTLSTHIARVHLKVQRNFKPKICEVCGKSFTSRKSLVEHLNSHLGVRPHVCEDCGATFIYSAALFTHRRLVHKVKRKSEMTT